jgi:hypothetical protein
VAQLIEGPRYIWKVEGTSPDGTTGIPRPLNFSDRATAVGVDTALKEINNSDISRGVS